MSAKESAYDWRQLPPATRPYAEVIGDPISQSKSPKIHNFWLGKLGIDAEYRAAWVRSQELAEYLAARRGDPLWRGCNVTMPHKQAVMGLVDWLYPVTARIGAVNTVVRGDDGVLSGYNTDAPGFFEPLAHAQFFFAPDKRVLLLGNGGAARAILVRLDDQRAGVIQPAQDKSQGAITIAVRDTAKGRALLGELAPDKRYVIADLASFARPAAPDAPRYDLVVNTSALGMVGNPPLAFDLSHVTTGGIVYDIVTTPLETPLLLAAKAAGLATIDGLAMLIGQARDAFHLFFAGDIDGLRVDTAWDAELRRILTA